MADRPARSGPAAETAPQVFVADLDRPELADEDRHHLERSRRLRPGDQVVCADGAGRWRVSRFAEVVEPIGPIRFQDRPVPALTVGFALVKGSRPELIVAKLTELGVDRIVAVAAARSVVVWDASRAAGHLARLSRVAREAAMQSRRAWLPEVQGPLSVAQVVRSGAGPDGLGPGPDAGDDSGDDSGDELAGSAVALAEPGGGPPSLARPTVLVGPEGGWTDDELDQVPHRVGLGPQILRVETAAITVGAVLVALRSGLVEPSAPPMVRRGLPLV